ncbi:MAG TPA: NADH-quinone oxidoreductase subunit C [Dehalococcoidia bacterium]|jgi:NADH/F420H2 dehydrogenase subunit C|nr:NADH-quinone oxidoreductase subunit C [Dehalococcoidia bacterium]
MTVSLSAWDVANQIKEQFPDAVSEINDQAILVRSESLFEVAQYLKNRPELNFDYLNYISAVDYFDYFELVYQLISINHNHSLILKTRCYGRDNPTLPSLVSLWRGADFQEREIYDLIGITFKGHPNLKRIVLWDGFQGHPLRKDYL